MFKPSQKILEKYAEVLVNFALGNRKGIKKGDVVMSFIPDVAKPLLVEINRAVIKAGGHSLIRMIPTDIQKDVYNFSSDEQLKFFPSKYVRERVNLVDHQVGIIADTNLEELKEVDPSRIMLSAKSRKKLRDWQNKKENRGKFTWTIGLYGTSAMAEESGMSLKEYWDQIIKACFLDKSNPITHWEKIQKEQLRIKNKLTGMKIKTLHIVGKNTDLTVLIGKKRKWLGGGGRNIPSFEIFTSPDWRGTEGFIYFNQPLYMYGNIVRDIRLEFKAGKVIKIHARRGKQILEKMVGQHNANKVGEVSLTDSRASRITKFMANTLYDENIGGRYGNMHIALGMAYKDTLDGDPSKLKKSEWNKLGFNDCHEHKDMVSTENRTVTATLKSGRKKVIYKDGKFTI